LTRSLCSTTLQQSQQNYERVVMAKSESLGHFEWLVVAAVMALRGNAYGLQVYERVCELDQAKHNPGSIYTTLDRLVNKGYLSSTIAKEKSGRGGTPSKIYRVQPVGVLALKKSVETAQRVSKSFFASWRLLKWKPKPTEPQGSETD
jgi:PadR family transcriptional regulator PadR